MRRTEIKMYLEVHLLLYGSAHQPILASSNSPLSKFNLYARINQFSRVSFSKVGVLLIIEVPLHRPSM